MNHIRIARHLKCCRQTVSRVIKRYDSVGTIEPKKPSGRPRKLTKAQERLIVINAKKNRRITRQRMIDDLQLEVSRNTISHVLKKYNLSYRVARKKPLIRSVNQRLRLQFARNYVNMPLEFWRRVLFTDQSRFASHSDRRRSWVIRYSSESLKRNCLDSTWKSDLGMTVWGAMGYNSIDTLVHIQRNMDTDDYFTVLDIGLNESVIKNNFQDNWVFQMDNDPKHTSGRARRYYQEHHLEVLE